MDESNVREEFARRMLNAAHQFRREVAATGDADEVLSHDEIAVNLTEDGAEVHFFTPKVLADDDHMSIQRIEGKKRAKDKPE